MFRSALSFTGIAIILTQFLQAAWCLLLCRHLGLLGNLQVCNCSDLLYEGIPSTRRMHIQGSAADSMLLIPEFLGNCTFVTKFRPASFKLA